MIRSRLTIGLILIPAFLSAGENGTRAGFDFLRSSMGARTAAMGGACAALIGDLHAWTYNPASLAGARPMEAAFTFFDQPLDINTGFLAFQKSFSRLGWFAASVLYTNYGTFRRTDIIGDDLGSFTPGDFAVSIGYANRFASGLQYGGTIKFLYSKIDQFSASAMAVDLGVIYRIESQDANIGFSVLNLGRSIDAYIEEHEKLPLSFRLGAAKALAHLPLLLNVSIIKYAYDESRLLWGLYWALGGEFTITDKFLLRWGYHSKGGEQKAGADGDRFAGLSLGLGVRIGSTRLDYGLISQGALGMMNQFTFSFVF